MKNKYLVVPGFVTSKSDGQTHWISAKELMGLYGVRSQDCVIAGWNPSDFRHRVEGQTLTVLHPDYHGRYDLNAMKPESFDPAEIGTDALMGKVEGLAHQAGGLLRRRARERQASRDSWRRAASPGLSPPVGIPPSKTRP